MEYNLGKVLLTPKGEYNGSTTYETLDVVSYNGSSYAAKQATTGNVPSEGQTNQYWQLLASGAAGGGGGSVTGISVDNQQYDPDVNGIVTLPDYPTVPVRDVKIGGVSILSDGNADIATEGIYNASTNKIATMSDLPTVPVQDVTVGGNSVVNNGTAAIQVLTTNELNTLWEGA